MKKVTLLSVIALIGIGLIALVVFYSQHETAIGCHSILSLDESRKLVDSLDKDSYTFASSTRNIFNESSEGGIQTNYIDSSGNVRIIEQRLYGAIGRTFMRFYYEDQQLVALVKLDERYKVPISVDNNAVVSESAEEDYYFSSTGRVCSSFLNGQPQTIGTTTQEMIASFIPEIKQSQ